MIELVCDIGSKTVRIGKKDAGLVVSEPAIAVIKYDKRKMSLVAAGNAVKSRMGRLEPDEQLVYPIKDGIITHKKAAILMLSSFMEAVVPVKFFKPQVKVLACISCGMSNVEKQDMETVIRGAGATSVTMIESPAAAAQLCEDKNICLADIGGHKTELAILSGGRIISGCSIAVGGEAFNQAIVDFVAEKYRTLLERLSCEKLKKSLASMYAGDLASATVSGKSVTDGGPKTLRLQAWELREAMIPVMDKIVEALESILNTTPDQIAEDVYNAGVMLCGGSANLPGIADYLGERVHMNINVMKNPENACANGALKFFYNKEALAKVLNLARV